MRHPRYVVASTTGYSVAGNYALRTSYIVCDSWYCYREQLLVHAHPQSGDAYGKVTFLRGFAERVCARLNAEHDAWLAAPSDA